VRLACLPLAALLLPIFATKALAASDPPADSPCPPHLFVIERSTNANVVVYDANRRTSGELVSSQPVVAYWLMRAEDGKREELNVIERQRAYGFDTSPSEEDGTYILTFKAGKKRRLSIHVVKGCPVATGKIGGHSGTVRRIFVQSTGSSLRPTVEYVEFFGEDAAGAPLYEKFKPGK